MCEQLLVTTSQAAQIIGRSPAALASMTHRLRWAIVRDHQNRKSKVMWDLRAIHGCAKKMDEARRKGKVIGVACAMELWAGKRVITGPTEI